MNSCAIELLWYFEAGAREREREKERERKRERREKVSDRENVI